MRFIILTIFSTAIVQIAFSQNDLTISISESRIKRDVYVLASDSMEGRQSPSMGQVKAAKYIAKQMVDAGLQPTSANDNPFYQYIPLRKEDVGLTNLTINGRSYCSGVDFSFASTKPYKDCLQLAARVIGYTTSDLVSNASADTALYLFDKSLDSAVARASRIAKKTKAIFFIISTPSMNQDKIQRIISNELSASKDIYPVSIFKKTAKERIWINSYLKDTTINIKIFLFPNCLYDKLYGRKINDDNTIALRNFKKGIPTKGALADFTLTSDFKGKRITDYDENVIGMIEGTDLKDEFVIVCGHYDHLGKKSNDSIFYGADDNASGTAAMLEVARTISDEKRKGNGPRRSVLFIAFTAEELGLNGSYYYAKNPIIPLNKTAMVLNMDMVGRSDVRSGVDGHLFVASFGKYKRQIKKISKMIDKQLSGIHFYYHLSVIDYLKFYFGSDHYPFVKEHIPATVLSINDQPDYHEVTDTPNKINYHNLANITKTAFIIVNEVANNPSIFPLKVK